MGQIVNVVPNNVTNGGYMDAKETGSESTSVVGGSE